MRASGIAPRTNFFSAAVAAVLICSAGAAHAGPCTAKIAHVEQQMAHPGPDQGPTAPQSTAAQLSRQPTPQSVEKAEHQASASLTAALDRARKADAAGDATACTQALKEVKDLYGLE